MKKKSESQSLERRIYIYKRGMPIDVRIYMFLNITLTNNLPFESFPLVQFLLIVLFVKVTYISNDVKRGLRTLRGAL